MTERRAEAREPGIPQHNGKAHTAAIHAIDLRQRRYLLFGGSALRGLDWKRPHA